LERRKGFGFGVEEEEERYAKPSTQGKGDRFELKKGRPLSPQERERCVTGGGGLTTSERRVPGETRLKNQEGSRRIQARSQSFAQMRTHEYESSRWEKKREAATEMSPRQSERQRL